MELKKEMTVWGIGGRWLARSLAASVPVIVVAIVFRGPLRAVPVPPWLYCGAGILLLLVGIPFWFISAVTLKKAYMSETLCTDGVFALCRNPIYAAWILLLVPGILLFFRNPLLLVIPFIMVALLRGMLSGEETWLEEKYGEAYRDYARRVPRILPIGACRSAKTSKDS